MFRAIFRKQRSMIKKILNHTTSMHQHMIQTEMAALRNLPRHQDPKSLAPFGHKIYSQNDEDGIIREIFNRIGTTNKTFVEFGVDDGKECNSYALLFDDWRGLWIDACTKYTERIKKSLAEIIESEQLVVVESFITADNINETISAHIKDHEIDLLSVDIDGNDYHVFNAITCINPRVVVMEYNAKFPPPISFCMDYHPSHVFGDDDCFGASLTFLETHLAAKGYRLVGCNLTGLNAFFVREDLVSDKFKEPFTAECHYEPARYHLSGLSAGWTSSYNSLLKSRNSRSSVFKKS